MAAAAASDVAAATPWAAEVAERAPDQASFLGKLFGPRGGKLDDVTCVVALCL
jgi:hypothetical protein